MKKTVDACPVLALKGTLPSYTPAVSANHSEDN